MTRKVVRCSFVFLLSFLFFFQTAQADLVASLPGEFSVSSSGSAEYSIPIEVLPGTAGVQPELSLNYSSQGRNGLLGVGWSIGGLSVIHRCPATLVKDGFIDGIDFDSNDRFCLDGQPLIAVSGNYGADQTEYKTELDNFSKIVSYGSTGNGPQYFKVWTKSGDVMEYGNTSDSLINPPLANGTTQADALCWLLNKVSDSVGNYMTVTYFEDTTTGENYPLTIDYTGNSAQSLTPFNSIEFEYETRADSSTKYLAGLKLNSTKRLKTITSKENANTIREYKLNYVIGSYTDRSVLTAVELCDGSSCLPSTDISTSNGTQKSFDSAYTATTSYNTPSGWYLHKHYSTIRFPDLNGDGLSDICGMADSGMICAISNGTNLINVSNWSSSFNVGWSAQQNYSTIQFPDLNGDGLPDICGRADSGIYCEINNGTSFVNGSYWSTSFQNAGGWYLHKHYSTIRFLDLNGDGRADVCGRWDGGIYCEINNGTNFSSGANWTNAYGGGGWGLIRHYSTIQYPDLNGDGLPDICGRADSGMYCEINNGTGFASGSYWSSTFNVGWSAQQNYSTIQFPDLNGDGLADICGRADSGIVCEINSGTNFINASHWTTYYSTAGGWYLHKHYSTIKFADLNGDSLADICGMSDSGMICAINDNGSAFTGLANWSSAFNVAWSAQQNYSTIQYSDINGDGLPDICGRADSGITCAKNSGQLSDLVTNLTNAFDTSIDIEYKPLTNTSVYTKSSSAVFPEVDIQTPMYVVSESRTDNGIGSQNILTYSYEGAKAHVQGRGFLGFNQRTVSDAVTGITIETNYRQDFPYIGLVSSVETKVGSTLVSKETNTYSAQGNVTVGPAFPFASQSVSETFDLNGGALISTNTTDTTMDTFGNPTQLVVTTVDAGVETYVTTTNNTYTNDTTKWHLGRLTQATVTKQQGTSSSPTRKSSFEYDAVTGLLTKEKIEPGTNMELVKTYAHDGFGNRICVIVEGSDISDQGATNTCDIGGGTVLNQGRITSTTYDSQGRFPVTVTNALSHVETREYNDPWGNVTKLTGPNNLDTLWEYDTLGRKSKETRADGTITNISYTFCDVSNPCPSLENGLTPSYFITTTNSGAPTQIAYYDAVNRVVLTETQSFDASAVFVETEFDTQGRTKRVSLPYFGTSPSYWTTNTYDALGRLIKEESSATGTTNYTYSGLVVTVSNDLFQINKEMKNSLDQTLWTQDDDLNYVYFTYDAAGNLTQVSDGINTTTNTYDIRGFKTSMDDPDMGHWEYEYNVLGELIKQWDAKVATPSPTNATVEMSYDVLGRLISRTESEGTTTWTYDTATTGKGKLHSVLHYGGYTRTHSYDTLGRPSSTNVTIGGSTFTTSNTYDTFGRVDEITYPTGFKVKQQYTSLGYLEKVVDQATPTLEYWKAQGMDEFGNITLSTVGGVLTAKDYENNSGRLFSINSGTATIQNLSYSYDSLGNLTQRKDLIQNKTEDFTYDNINRLTEADLVGVGTKTFAYDALGNITNKSDVGSYTYGQNNAGPHAVTTANGVSYSYDANGNMTGGNGRTLTWSSYNKPIQIQQGSNTVNFSYGPDRARYQQTATDGTTTKITTYVGNLYEKELVGTTVTNKHYIRAGNQAIAIHTTRSVGPTDTRYLHRDHLGSIDVITDENQTIVEQLSFGAFGERRQSNWSDAIGSITSSITRGFTGHEQLDSVGLIHMNGRVYDPKLGRFLSADPFIQFAKNLQSYNRYSYVLNNPLSFTDPSGFFLKKAFKKLTGAIKKVVKAVTKTISSVLNKIASNPYLSIAASIAVGFGAYKLALNFTKDLVVAGAAGGFAGGFVGSGGDIQAGIVGGLTGAAAGFIAGLDINRFQAALAHGAVGGAAAEVQGGKFGQGFASSFLTKAVSRDLANLTRHNPIAGGAAAAIVGGTISKLTGGKFQNGALTSSFQYLFSEAVNELESSNSRALTADEVKLAESVFGDSLDYSKIRIFNKKYFLFQPKNVAMAPNGNIYFHPDSALAFVNFGTASIELQGLFIHELTHVYQHQQGINVAVRGIFNRNYSYTLESGKAFESYGIEQQGNIVRDYFFLQKDSAGGPAIERYNAILPF